MRGTYCQANFSYLSIYNINEKCNQARELNYLLRVRDNCSSSTHTPPLPSQFPSSWHYPVFLYEAIYRLIGQTSFETRQAFTNFMSTNQKSLLLLSYCTCYTLIWITCVKIEKIKTKQKNIKISEKHNVMSKKKFKTCKKRQKDAYEKKRNINIQKRNVFCIAIIDFSFKYMWEIKRKLTTDNDYLYTIYIYIRYIHMTLKRNYNLKARQDPWWTLRQFGKLMRSNSYANTYTI